MMLRRLLIAALLIVSSAAVAADVVKDPAPVRLEGLDPANYMQRRNRTPELSVELRALPVDTLLRLLRDDGAVAWPADETYPALKPAEREAWRAKERRAVKHGVLAILARSDDARVEAALVKATDDVDLKVAASAAERLGLRPGREALLAGIATDARRALDVRAGACAGLGAQRSVAAVDALVAVLASADLELQRSALIALENAGSRWAFEASGDVAAGAALRAHAVFALDALKLDGEAGALTARTASRLKG